MPGLRQRMVGFQHPDLGTRPAFHGDDLRRAGIVGREIARERLRFTHRGREPHCREIGGEGEEPGEIEREQISALGGDEGVQFVEHDALQSGKEIARLAMSEHQGELLGGGEQDLRRTLHLACPLVGRRVAGAGLDGEIKPHLPRRGLEIAGHIDGERLQRRDIERVQPARAGFRCRLPGQSHHARQESCQRLARTGGGNEQRAGSGVRQRKQFQLMLTRLPAATGEPVAKARRQKIGRIVAHVRGHSSPCIRKEAARSLAAAGKFPHAPRFRLAFDTISSMVPAFVVLCAASLSYATQLDDIPARPQRSVSGNPHCEGICQGRGNRRAAMYLFKERKTDVDYPGAQAGTDQGIRREGR